MDPADDEGRVPSPPPPNRRSVASPADPVRPVGGDGRAGPRPPPLSSAGAEWEAFQQVLAEVRARTGRDITRYSTQAVTERVQRRMEAHGMTALRDYAALLNTDDREARRLSDAFWPPPDTVFPAPSLVPPGVLPLLFDGKGIGDQLRVWVVGCAAGASTYATAMLLLDYMAALAFAPDLRVFASDPRSELMQQARAAVYPDAALAGVDPGWPARYFAPDPGGLRVRRSVRDNVLFAEHHVLDDAPFLHLDLIVCRGYLPQLRADLQAQVLELFHYVLNPGGVLCLGGDTVSPGDLFAPTGAQPGALPGAECLRRRTPRHSAAPPALPLTWLRRPRPEAAAAADAPPAAEQLAAHTPPAGLLLGPDLQVRYVGSRAARYLHQGAGVPTAHAGRLVRPELGRDVHAALERAAEGRPYVTRAVPVPLEGELRAVRVAARPLSGTDLAGFVAVEFHEEAAERAGGEPGTDAAALQDASARAQLRRMAEEHFIALEEMSAINEELRGVNGELRAALTHLEASKRDLEASNRELALLNLAHHDHIAELNRTTADLENFLVALDIATLFLDRNLCVRRFTPRAATLFDLGGDALGRALAYVGHSLYYENLVADAARVLAQQEALQAEVACPDGRWHLMQLLPYRAYGGLVDGVVATFVDITARKQAEITLQQLNADLERRVAERTAELERSNHELDQFAYVASHDLKAPLRAISFLAAWIEEDARGVLPEAARQHLANLTKRTARMETLLNDLLTYARAGRSRHSLVSIGLEELARNVTELVEPPEGFAVTVEGEGAHTRPLHVERVPLELVLRNLVSNALKHHWQPEQGHVWITCRDGEGRYEFTVRDDGPGIDPAHHRRIFDIFQTLRPRDQVEGSGLGLAVVKKTVESRGGTVTVESAPGAGSIFRFTWPKAVEQ